MYLATFQSVTRAWRERDESVTKTWRVIMKVKYFFFLRDEKTVPKKQIFQKKMRDESVTRAWRGVTRLK